MAKTETTQDDNEVIQSLKKFVSNANSRLSDRYTQICESLEIAGGMPDEEDKKLEKDGLPNKTLMALRPFFNRIINGFRKNPFNSMIESKVYGKEEKAKKAQAYVRGIKTKSNIKTIGGVSIDRQVKSGWGYIALTTDYMSAKKGFEQEIKLLPVHRPDMVIDDPYSMDVTSGDSSELCLVQHMSVASAKNEFGADIIDERKKDTFPLSGSRWTAPVDCVEVVTYYRMKRGNSNIYMGEDGSEVKEDDVRKNAKIKGTASKSRQIQTSECEIFKIIGDKVVSRTTLPIDRIPVFSMRGEMIDRNGKVDWVGLTYFGKNLAKIADMAMNEAIVRIAKAPRSMFVVDALAVADHKEQFSDNLPRKYLSYISRDGLGNPLQAPSLQQVSVDTSDLANLQTNALQTLSAVLGMEVGGGMIDAPNNKSATEVLTRSRSEELSNYQFPDNAAETFKAIDNVIVQLFNVIYDTERLVPSETEDGFSMEQVNVSELGIEADELSFDIEGGIMDATETSENLSKILALATLVPEDTKKLFPEIIRLSGVDGADRLAELLNGGGEDPDAIEAMTQMEAGFNQRLEAVNAEVEQSKLYIQQLQMENWSLKNGNEVKVLTTQMQNESKEYIEQMKLAASNEALVLELTAKHEDAQAKLIADIQKANASQPQFNIVSGADPQMNAIGGQRNDLFK